MKFRLVKRARGWVIQSTDGVPVMKKHSASPVWNDIKAWRFRFIAALHLLWLRERARSR